MRVEGLACVDLDREPQARCRRDLGWEAIDAAVSNRAPLERGRPEPRIEPATQGGHDGAEWAWHHRDEVEGVRVAERSGEGQVLHYDNDPVVMGRACRRLYILSEPMSSGAAPAVASEVATGARPS